MKDAILKRILLSIEFLFLCGPAIALLLLGIVFSPVFLFGTLQEKGDWYIGLLMTVFGAWGLLSLINLSWSVIFRIKKWSGKSVQWFGIISGLLVCLTGLIAFNDRASMFFTFLGPVILTLHLLYLDKNSSEVSL